MSTDGPIQKRKIHQEVQDRLMRRIESGEIRPGDQLPPERELMELYGVGRPAIREALRGAANDETEHLAWTEQRINELGGRKSLLNPLLYLGSLSLGLLAGALGDKWNLGFLAETGRQVEAHLDGHLLSLPADDGRSRAIVDQMRLDEIEHAETAIQYGAAELPPPVKAAMKMAAKVMTGAAYRI